MWERDMDIHKVVELRTRTTCFLGVGAIHKIDSIAEDLVRRGVRRVLVVSSKSAYLKTGAWDVVLPALKKHGIEASLYAKVVPNPTDLSVDEAVRQGREFGAQAVLGIGGGSPIDAAKSIAILLEYPGKTARDLYTFAFAPDRALPVVAINTTHGTGTEVDRFAVVSIPELQYKPAIAYDCIYPLYAIDDPGLMVGLPADQTRFVSIDAINHVLEAATSKVASPYSVMMAKETVRLVAEYLPRALENPKDLEARYYLLYASAIAGISFDNGLLHFTHALEHPLSAVKPDLAHGLGLAMILPAVVRTIYAARASTLADLLSPLVPGLAGVPQEAEAAARGVEDWLARMGVSDKLEDQGYSDKDVDTLTELAFSTPSLSSLLAIAPVEATRDTVAHIYRASLRRSSRA